MKCNSSLFQTPMSFSGMTGLSKSSFRGPSSARQPGIPFPPLGEGRMGVHFGSVVCNAKLNHDYPAS